MSAFWFFPVAVLVGLAGTQTTLRRRHANKGRNDLAWWLLLVLAWLPLVCWLASLFVTQD